jgi:hypothetical protein
MRRILRNHGGWSGAVAVLCILILLVMATAQVVHSHPDSANSARHTCSICSTPHAKLSTAQNSGAPVMLAEPLAGVEPSAPRIFRPATTNFVRPPPAA